MRIVVLGVALAGMAWGQRCESCERDEHGRIARSPRVVAEFKRQTPCPFEKGDCRADHVVPLACADELGLGTADLDRPENLQWQTKDEAKKKDRWERKRCKELYDDPSFDPTRELVTDPGLLAPMNKFADLYNRLALDLRKGKIDLKLAREVSEAWRKLEESSGWPKTKKR